MTLKKTTPYHLFILQGFCIQKIFNSWSKFIAKYANFNVLKKKNSPLVKWLIGTSMPQCDARTRIGYVHMTRAQLQVIPM